MKLREVTIFIIILIQSCATLDSTQKTNIKPCELHGTKLKKSIVGTHYGRGCPDANTKEFPNGKRVRCLGCVVRHPRKFIAISLNCPDCTRIKRKTELKPFK